MASTEDRVNTPEWILRLENKNKRTHKLAHEIGAGAPCLQCSICPGLDLHFWRKLCKKCKCKKEEHDFIDEDGCEQFEILLGVGHKKQTPKRAYLNVRVAGSGIEILPPSSRNQNQSVNKNDCVSFDWIPPDVPSDLAEEYMSQLPLTKIPISGTDGAQYRRMQMEKQVPIHDLDANKCHGLTPEEIDRMRAYVDEIKSNVVGQGRVTKLLDPVMYMEQRVMQMTPHSGLVSGEPVKAQSMRQNTSGISKQSYRPPNASFNSSDPVTLTPPPTPSPPLAFGNMVPQSLTSSVPTPILLDDTPESPPPPLPSSPPPLFDSAAEKFDLIGIPGPTDHQHNQVPMAGSLFPPHMGHAMHNQVLAKPGMPGAYQGDNSEYDMEWPAPPSSEEMGVNGEGQDRNISAKENGVTRGGLPALMGGLSVTDDGRPSEGTLEMAAPKWNCHKCKEPVRGGEVVVKAERAGENVCWHPQCFVCKVCQELLVDLIYFFRKGEVYCGRHFAEIMDIPRCNACDELIFVPNYTCAEGQSYHVKHFCCFECDIPLGGMKYILVDGQPNCLNCYQAKYGKTCHTCKQSIAAGDQRVSWKDFNWHVSPNCFCCASCKKHLLGGKFTVKETQPFCSRACVETFFCPQTAL